MLALKFCCLSWRGDRGQALTFPNILPGYGWFGMGVLSGLAPNPLMFLQNHEFRHPQILDSNFGTPICV